MQSRFLNRAISIDQGTLKGMFKVLNIREMQIKTNFSFPLTPIIMTKMKNSGASTYWVECGARGTLLRCW